MMRSISILFVIVSTLLQNKQHVRGWSFKAGKRTNVLNPSRRMVLGGITGAVQLTWMAKDAQARDELFRPNPLTNPVLEQVGVGERMATCWFVAFCISLW